MAFFRRPSWPSMCTSAPASTAINNPELVTPLESTTDDNKDKEGKEAEGGEEEEDNGDTGGEERDVESTTDDNKDKEGKEAEGGEEEEDNGDTGGEERDVGATSATNFNMYYPWFAFPGGYYPPPPPAPGYVYQPSYQPPAYTPHHQMMAPQIFSNENPNACSII
ncbi:hypothetical protein BAE44_0007768 [Dichanthelium oligosanthes]|uniref:Uncharacterized protein n=1 Tax=Dichanthelium oligosanthes TaxID=888268 RepID=A0A1E5W1G8_9POAL|nr:hypothetical protein BAE44_0007768 [Dichanthelium oligosanthes]